jgi:hypothetical protein
VRWRLMCISYQASKKAAVSGNAARCARYTQFHSLHN